MRDEITYEQINQAAAAKHSHKRNMVSVVSSGLTNTNPSVGALAAPSLDGKSQGFKYKDNVAQ